MYQTLLYLGRVIIKSEFCYKQRKAADIKKLERETTQVRLIGLLFVIIIIMVDAATQDMF